MRDKDGIAITEERCCRCGKIYVEQPAHIRCGKIYVEQPAHIFKIKDRHGRAKHFCGWTCYNAYKKEEGKA